ncbi:hypothetical protein Tco_0480977 [Tanacetum coccineum]
MDKTTRPESDCTDDALVAPPTDSRDCKNSSHVDSFHKMYNKKHIVNLEYFRAMLQICPKLPNQQFEELPFEEAILTFLKDLGHSGEIKVITDVNVNKLNQSWRSFAAVLNKCSELKSTGYDHIYLTISSSNPWGIQNSVNWHYARDDYMFTTIKVVSRHEDTQLAEPPKMTKIKCQRRSEVGSDQNTKNSSTLKGKRLKLQQGTKPLRESTPQRRLKDKDAENQDDDDEQTDSDNDGDDFVHPKFSTHDEEDKEEDSFNPRVQTPSHVKSTDDEDNDEEIQDANVEGDKMNEEETNKGAEVDALYKETRSTIEFLYVIWLRFKHAQPKSRHRLKTLENNFSEFNQTNQSVAAVSSISGIVDAYLAKKMHEAVKIAVQLQSERLSDEAQAENADFLNKLDDNIKKIIKDQVKEQVKAKVSNILSKIEKTVNEQLEAELKKILIDKMESNKSIHRSDEQNNLYKALVNAYESDKLILDTYRDIVSFKIHRNDKDKDEEPSVGSTRGSKRIRAGKRTKSTCTKGKDLQDNWQVN